MDTQLALVARRLLVRTVSPEFRSTCRISSSNSGLLELLNNPDALLQRDTEANAAGSFWADNNLPGRTTQILNRTQFNAITQTVNGGQSHATERWQAYQRALDVLR
jgi:predicted chitinase